MTRIMCIGHAVQDYVFGMAELPDGGKKHRASTFECVGGGPAATAAAAIARLGGEAHLAARIGDDAVADAIVAELETYGVDCARVRRFPGRSSSLSAVMVDAKGERMIINYRDGDLPGAAAWLGADFFDGADAVLADTRWIEGAVVAMKSARAAGVPAILDADEPTPDAPELLGAASHLAFSADGLRGLTGSQDLRAGLTRIQERYGAWTCATDGARGVLVIDGAGARSVGAFRTEVVDTLGAGDVWHGAFALALGEGASEINAVRFANAAAAVKVSRTGGRKGAPTRTEVDAFLRLNQPMESAL